MKNKNFLKWHAKAHKKFEPYIKSLDFHDLWFAKFAIVFAVLFLLTVWPSFAALILGIHWGWYLIAMIVFGLRPMIHCCKCCKKK